MMTADELRDWENELLLNHDLSDLADCVQLLRTLNWSTIGIGQKLDGAFVWFKDLDAFAPVIAQLDEIAAGDTVDAPLAEVLAGLYEAVHDALESGPRKPSEEEIIQRFSNGEIGDRTARYVLGVDVWEFMEVCQKYGKPPIQLGGDE